MYVLSVALLAAFFSFSVHAMGPGVPSSQPGEEVAYCRTLVGPGHDMSVLSAEKPEVGSETVEQGFAVFSTESKTKQVNASGEFYNPLTEKTEEFALNSTKPDYFVVRSEVSYQADKSIKVSLILSEQATIDFELPAPPSTKVVELLGVPFACVRN